MAVAPSGGCAGEPGLPLPVGAHSKLTPLRFRLPTGFTESTQEIPGKTEGWSGYLSSGAFLDVSLWFDYDILPDSTAKGDQEIYCAASLGDRPAELLMYRIDRHNDSVFGARLTWIDTAGRPGMLMGVTTTEQARRELVTILRTATLAEPP